MVDDIRAPFPTHSAPGASRDGVARDSGRGTELTTTVLAQDGKLGIGLHSKFLPLTISLDARAGDIVRVRIEPPSIDHGNKETIVRVLRILSHPSRGPGLAPTTPRSLRDFFPAASIKPLQELLLTLREVLEQKGANDQKIRTAPGSNVAESGLGPDHFLLGRAPLPQPRNHHIPAAYGAGGPLPEVGRMATSRDPALTIAEPIPPIPPRTTPPETSLRSLVEAAVRTIAERVAVGGKQYASTYRTEASDNSTPTDPTARRFQRLVTEAAPILDQFNRLFESLNQPSYLLTSLGTDTPLIPLELSLLRPPRHPDRSGDENEQQIDRSEMADKGGSRSAQHRTYTRLRMTIHFPALGPVGIDVAYREAEVLLKVTSPSSQIAAFITGELPTLVRELNEAGYTGVSWFTDVGEVGGIMPEWFRELVEEGVVA